MPLSRLAVTLTLAALASLPVSARETDSFTGRHEALAFPVGQLGGRPIADFTDELNGQINLIVADALIRLNEENYYAERTCESPKARRRLFGQLSHALGGPIIITRNRLRSTINNHPGHFKTKLEQSIYRDFPPWSSISLGLLSKFGDKMAEAFRFDLEEILVAERGRVVRLADGSVRVLGSRGRARSFRLREIDSPVLEAGEESYYLLDTGQALVESGGTVRRLTPVIISSDKFSHFFFRGMSLFKKLESAADPSFEEIVAANFRSEVSLWGSKSTGVAAYGDLVANFHGMRFWIHLLGEDLEGRPAVDPMAGVAIRPYLSCSEHGTWVQEREIDIASYLDPAWDEGLNCSRVRSESLLEMVTSRIEQLNREDVLGRSYDCPVEPELIQDTAARYGRWAPHLINQEGHALLSPEDTVRGRNGRQDARPAARLEQSGQD